MASAPRIIDPRETNIRAVITYPIPEDQDTIREICTALTDGDAVKWCTPAHPTPSITLRNSVIYAILKDYHETYVYDIPYKAIIDSIWARIRTHADKNTHILAFVKLIITGMRLKKPIDKVMLLITNVLAM